MVEVLDALFSNHEELGTGRGILAAIQKPKKETEARSAVYNFF